MASGARLELRTTEAEDTDIQPISDPSRIDLITTAVRDIIAHGHSLPPERELADRLGVKRHRLRSALEALRREGQIGRAAVGRRRSTPPSTVGEDLVGCTNPYEVIEMRLIIEPGLARLAALRASPSEIARIEAAATTKPGDGYGAADLAFHMAVAAGARNSLGVELYALLRRVGTDARVRIGGKNNAAASVERLQQRDAEHQAIAAAIVARDADGAEKAMRSHLIAVQRRIIERLTPGLTAA